MVRLRNQDGDVIGTASVRLEQIAFRTIRHDGHAFERVSDGADGMREYRATDPIPLRPMPAPARAALIDVHGAHLATIALPDASIPASVMVDGVVCPLWTCRDQSGRALYLKPEPVDGV